VGVGAATLELEEEEGGGGEELELAVLGDSEVVEEDRVLVLLGWVLVLVEEGVGLEVVLGLVSSPP